MTPANLIVRIRTEKRILDNAIPRRKRSRERRARGAVKAEQRRGDAGTEKNMPARKSPRSAANHTTEATAAWLVRHLVFE